MRVRAKIILPIITLVFLTVPFAYLFGMPLLYSFLFENYPHTPLLGVALAFGSFFGYWTILAAILLLPTTAGLMVCKNPDWPSCIAFQHLAPWLQNLITYGVAIGCILFYVSLVYALCILKENISTVSDGSRLTFRLAHPRVVGLTFAVPFVFACGVVFLMRLVP